MAAVALGAQPDALRKMYATHAVYQLPQMSIKYDINEDNLLDFYLKEDAYSSYLAFFDKKLETMSIMEVFDKYATLEPIFDGFFGGAFHPLIHFCYGVEFSEKLLVAEALAISAVQMQDPGFRVVDIFKLENMQLESKSIIQILDDIRVDSEIQSAVKYTDPVHFVAMGKSKIANEKILKHTAYWHVAGMWKSPAEKKNH